MIGISAFAEQYAQFKAFEPHGDLETECGRIFQKLKAGELIGKVHNSVYQQCRKRGYVAPVDVLMDVGILQKQKYEEWRFGKIPYLEAVCNCNLRQLSFLMKQIWCYADKTGLKPTFCYYKRWAGAEIKRRFMKNLQSEKLRRL